MPFSIDQLTVEEINKLNLDALIKGDKDLYGKFVAWAKVAQQYENLEFYLEKNTKPEYIYNKYFVSKGKSAASMTDEEAAAAKSQGTSALNVSNASKAAVDACFAKKDFKDFPKILEQAKEEIVACFKQNIGLFNKILLAEREKLISEKTQKVSTPQKLDGMSKDQLAQARLQKAKTFLQMATGLSAQLEKFIKEDLGPALKNSQKADVKALQKKKEALHTYLGSINVAEFGTDDSSEVKKLKVEYAKAVELDKRVEQGFAAISKATPAAQAASTSSPQKQQGRDDISAPFVGGGAKDDGLLKKARGLVDINKDEAEWPVSILMKEIENWFNGYKIKELITKSTGGQYVDLKILGLKWKPINDTAEQFNKLFAEVEKLDMPQVKLARPIITRIDNNRARINTYLKAMGESNEKYTPPPPPPPPPPLTSTKPQKPDKGPLSREYLVKEKAGEVTNAKIAEKKIADAANAEQAAKVAAAGNKIAVSADLSGAENVAKQMALFQKHFDSILKPNSSVKADNKPLFDGLLDKKIGSVKYDKNALAAILKLTPTLAETKLKAAFKAADLLPRYEKKVKPKLVELGWPLGIEK